MKERIIIKHDFSDCVCLECFERQLCVGQEWVNYSSRASPAHPLVCKQSFIGTQPNTFGYVASMAALLLHVVIE